jgi:tetratricopeptide (TPR) repeat protein
MSELIPQMLQAAVAFHQQGKLQYAETYYRQVLAQQADHPDALHMLGVLAMQTGRNDVAVGLIERAIECRVNMPEAYFNLALALQKCGEWERTIAACQNAIAMNPQLMQAYDTMGAALTAAGKADEAVAVYQQAIAVNPGRIEGYTRLAYALLMQRRFDEGIAALTQAMALRPTDANVQCLFGVAANMSGNFTEAEAAYRRSIALSPNLVNPHYFLGMLLLTQGKFREGWEEYEWRLKPADTITPDRSEEKKWDGKALNGRTLLLISEQGLGDAIQFVRYLPMLEQFGGKVILECRPELTRLLGKRASVITRGENTTMLGFDVYFPLLSLPRLFGTDLSNIPNRVPYLEADEKDAATWRARIGAGNELKVGLVWAGSPTHVNDMNRSMALADFAALGQVPGVKFFSLQKGPAGLQAPPAGMTFVNHAAELNDFADTAALVANLDLVIAVDTGIVHLAGAMGKPVWTLVPKRPDWRWMLEREDSPWYPTMRLFRQLAPGDWGGVMERVRAALTELAAAK